MAPGHGLLKVILECLKPPGHRSSSSLELQLPYGVESGDTPVPLPVLPPHLSPPPPPRQAESSLVDTTNHPSYALALLHLVAEPSVNKQIGQATIVNFKNHLRARWASSPTPHDTAATAIDIEKEQIKALIIPLMLSSLARIQTTHGAIPAGRGSWLRFQLTGSRPPFRLGGGCDSG
ncbi:hypothetical protein NL676_023667 [Syzygium grande]|nr:hypothetical protein NL676_023667 [Syzygium grande]